MTNTTTPIKAVHAIVNMNQFAASILIEIKVIVAAEYSGWRTHWKGP